MYARITTIQISPYRIDEAISVMRDHVVPAAQQQPGFKGFTVLVDRGTGKTFTISLWEREADRQVSGPDSSYYRDGIGKLVPLLTDAPMAEDLEIVIEV